MSNQPVEIACPHCQRDLELVSTGEADCPHCGTYFIVRDDLTITHVVPLRTSWVASIVAVIAAMSLIWLTTMEEGSRQFVIAHWTLVALAFAYVTFEGHRDGLLRVDQYYLSRRNHPIGFRLYIVGMGCLAIFAAVQLVRAIIGVA